jgi:hypothetical protein
MRLNLVLVLRRLRFVLPSVSVLVLFVGYGCGGNVTSGSDTKPSSASAGGSVTSTSTSKPSATSGGGNGGHGTGGHGGAPAAGCPNATPNSGDPCPVPNQSCFWQNMSSGFVDEIQCTCMGASWMCGDLGDAVVSTGVGPGTGGATGTGGAKGMGGMGGSTGTGG